MALQASRFALLSIDDDTDSDDKSCKSKSLSKKDVQQSTSAKKRNKKKKKNIEKLENDEVPFSFRCHIIARIVFLLISSWRPTCGVLSAALCLRILYLSLC